MKSKSPSEEAGKVPPTSTDSFAELCFAELCFGSCGSAGRPAHTCEGAESGGHRGEYCAAPFNLLPVPGLTPLPPIRDYSPGL